VPHLLSQSAPALAGPVYETMGSAHALVVPANAAFADSFAVPDVPVVLESWEFGRLIKDK